MDIQYTNLGALETLANLYMYESIGILQQFSLPANDSELCL